MCLRDPALVLGSAVSIMQLATDRAFKARLLEFALIQFDQQHIAFAGNKKASGGLTMRVVCDSAVLTFGSHIDQP
jgi:hypothetical protein